jgi:hypothetical protein
MPSVADVRNDRSNTPSPRIGIYCVYSDNFYFIFATVIDGLMTRIVKRGFVRHAVYIFLNDVSLCSVCANLYCKNLTKLCYAAQIVVQVLTQHYAYVTMCHGFTNCYIQHDRTGQC